MNKMILTASMKLDKVNAQMVIEPPKGELAKASIYEHCQKQLVFEMRKALEKKLAELTRDDLVYELKNESDL